MRRPSLAKGRVRETAGAGDVLEERPPKWRGVPDAARFADRILGRPEEVVFVTREEGAAQTVRAWGALGIARHPQGLWCERSLGALRGRDVVFLDNEPGSGFTWAAGDVEVLAGTVARVGLLVPEACRGESPPRHLVDGIAGEGHRGGLGLPGLIREAQAVLVALPPPDAEEDDGDWPALRRGLRLPVPAFPVDVFPERLAQFVREAGGPPDFAGLAVLVAAGAVAGRSALLHLRGDWSVGPALFGLNIGEPADGAWEALRAVLAPLREVDRGLRQAYEKALVEHERLPKREQPAAPICRALVVNECAPEILAAHLARNPRGLLVARDEADEWLLGLRPGMGAKRRLWHDGLDGAPLRIDPKRDANGVALHLDSPFLAFCGNIAPVRLQELDLGCTDVLDRVLVAFPDPTTTPWPGAELSDDARQAWDEAVNWLHARAGTSDTIEFADDARTAWAAWCDEQAKALNAPEADAYARGADQALRGFTARLALIVHLLHAASHPTRSPQERLGPVGLEAVRTGVRLAEYFRAHHRRARRAIGGGADDRIAQAIVQWVRRTERTRFSVSELTACLRWIGDERDELEIALRQLVDHNAIRRVSGEERSWKRGRPRTASYEVHPMFRKT